MYTHAYIRMYVRMYIHPVHTTILLQSFCIRIIYIRTYVHVRTYVHMLYCVVGFNANKTFCKIGLTKLNLMSCVRI